MVGYVPCLSSFLFLLSFQFLCSIETLLGSEGRGAPGALVDGAVTGLTAVLGEMRRAGFFDSVGGLGWADGPHGCYFFCVNGVAPGLLPLMIFSCVEVLRDCCLLTCAGEALAVCCPAITRKGELFIAKSPPRALDLSLRRVAR